MKTGFESIEENRIKVFFEASQESIDEGIDIAYKKNAKMFRVNGFRPGKAPKSVVLKLYGTQVLYDDALRYIVDKELDAFVKSGELELIQPADDFDLEKMSDTECKFSLKYYTKPVFEIARYTGIEVEIEQNPVTDEDVDAHIMEEAKKNTITSNVEDRAAEMGDTVVIDYCGYIDGVEFEGGKADGHSLKLGSNQFIPGFEEQLVGANAGDDVEVNVSFPDDYHAEEFKGKAATFKVKVNKITHEDLPEINDSFASDVSEFDTLEEYKASVKEKLNKEADTKKENKIESAVIKKIREENMFSIPEIMTKQYAEGIYEDRISYMARYNIDRKQAEGMLGAFDDVYPTIQKTAENGVFTELLCEYIIKKENFAPTDDELKEIVSKAVGKEEFNDEVFDNIMKNNREAVVGMCNKSKAIKLMIDTANVTVKEESKEDVDGTGSDSN